MTKQFLVLTPNNKAGVFNRSVRDAKGAIKDQMTFQHGVPVEIDSLSKGMMLAICDDIGNQLLVALTNESGVVKYNPEATNQLVVEIAESKMAKNKPLTAIQANAVAEFNSNKLQMEKAKAAAEAEALKQLEAEEAAAAAKAETAKAEAAKAETAKAEAAEADTVVKKGK